MASSSGRYHVLDGWRGISILLVLAGHLLPIGPKFMQLNATSASMGMALFFTLSGFLITNFLLHKKSVIDFIIRRVFRIVPLAWLYIAIVLFMSGYRDSETWLAHVFFFANWPPMKLTDATSHLWSLCVEMQFYFGIALVVTVFGKRGLFLIPLLCIAVTSFRVSQDILIAINTYYRIDEILSGCWLALVFNNKFDLRIIKINFEVNLKIYVFFILLLAISCHPESGFMNYFRPYLSSFLVGLSLYDHKTIVNGFLKNRVLSYLAAISYALYVIHGGMRYTWLGDGDVVEKYLKRPLFFVVLFFFAHLSTFYYENRCIAFGKRLSLSVQRFRRA